MPSLHAADAFILGVTLAYICRSRLAKLFWIVWPAWVAFAVMATANHFWLDVVAGFVLAACTLAAVHARRILRVVRPA
jgi:membrane-associated phospholipid phosphatase